MESQKPLSLFAKLRLAAAIVLMPILFLLNIGPIAYCNGRWGVGEAAVIPYRWGFQFIRDTALAAPYARYADWWYYLGKKHGGKAL
jgi:hypothetical protein